MAVAALIVVEPAAATPIDGTLDPEYGPPLATQTIQTSAGDNVRVPSMMESNGGELDQAYGYIADGVLHLFLAGNLLYVPGAELMGYWNPIDIFIDSVPGGQNTLVIGNPAINSYFDSNQMAGLTFDADFAADYWLSCGSESGAVPLRAYYGELPAGGGGSGYYLGYSAPGSPGVLSYGTNPYGILASLDNRNVGGVDGGCGTASGTGVTTGIELAIPLAAIGNAPGCIKVCAFSSSEDHSKISNQVLGALPPGVCGFTLASAVDFAAFPGDQFFTVCPSVADVDDRRPATVEFLPPVPNPARQSITLSVAIPATRAGDALDLAVFDVAGRRLQTLVTSPARAGRFEVSWDLRDRNGKAVGAGIYFARLSAGSDRWVRTLVVAR